MSSLPTATEPLVLADGTKIDPVSGKVLKKEMIEIPSNTEMQRAAVAARRKLADMPMPPQQMNAVALVLAYKMIGLDDIEISAATGIEQSRIGKIQMTPIYRELSDQIIAQLIENDADDIRAVISQSAKVAARKMSQLVMSNDDMIALSAAKDVLDRGGHRPADIVLHKHKIEGGLRVVYTEDNSNTVPGMVIDATAIEGDTNGHSA